MKLRFFSGPAEGAKLGVLLLLTFGVLPGCVGGSDDVSAADDDAREGDDDGQPAGGAYLSGSGGSAEPQTGGAGGATGGGPLLEGTGGGALAPVDCSGIPLAGYELCDSSPDTCGAVFMDSSGCSAVCAAAGLECVTAFENADDACAAELSLPELACDSGHQSDYCECGRLLGSAGTGGASSTGGASGSGGAAPSDSDDCNAPTTKSVLTVGKSGAETFSTVQSAIDSLPGGNTTPTILRISPGTYYEKLSINVPNITLCGQVGKEATTVLTYSDGADTPNGNGGTVGTSGSASVNLSADDVSVENLTIENTRGVGSQAVALLVSGSRVQFRNSRFLGHQDTVYVKEGSQYFRDSHIEGTVDYIFGGATAVFDECVIHNVGGGSAVTAPSTDEAVPFGIVFLGGQLTAAPGVSSGSVNLGRNWRPYGATAYIQTTLGAHIAAAGWIKMGDNELSTARFSEYQSSGPGANAGARASESKQLNAGEAAAYTVDNLFGAWDPGYAN